ERLVGEVRLQRLDEASFRFRGEVVLDRGGAGHRVRALLEIEDRRKRRARPGGGGKRNQLRAARLVGDGDGAVGGAEVDPHPAGRVHFAPHFAASFRTVDRLRIVAGPPIVFSSTAPPIFVSLNGRRLSQ